MKFIENHPMIPMIPMGRIGHSVTVPREWGLPIYVVAGSHMRERMIARGVDPARIFIAEIPARGGESARRIMEGLD